jgi:N-ethylmaleimide reductase
MGTMNDIHDENPEATYGYIAERLSDYRFAYLHIVKPAMERMQSGKEPRALKMVGLIRKKYEGTLIVAVVSRPTPRRNRFAMARRT